jgi:ATP-dependent DNA helicase PIF1
LNTVDLVLSPTELKIFALSEIEKLLQSNNKSLSDFPTMPQPDLSLITARQNRLIYDELNYDRHSLVEEHTQLMSTMTSEQRRIYDKVMTRVAENKPGLFFLYGYGGTGKTYIWRAMSAALRSKGDIVLTVASSGIAALLIPGGRTAHSRFSIPIQVDENSTCNIKQGSPLAELIVEAKLIIWDEAPMTHKHCFEAVDRTFRDILRFCNSENLNLPFGGKVVVMGGDFRQILPVIPKGTRQEVVHATINSSYLWDFCEVMMLHTNMRLLTCSLDSDFGQRKEFSDWILGIGDGNVGEDNDVDMSVQIPDELLIKSAGDSLASIVYSTYPSFLDNMNDLSFFQERAILAPKNDIVDKINDYMLSLIPGDQKTYLSLDSPCSLNSDIDNPDNVHTTEFLNTINAFGLPTHIVKLKVGVPVMLLRNINHSSGLCNGTRLIITRMGKYVLEGKVISGSNLGHKVYIPRLSLTPSDVRIPFKFQRKQFPLTLSFAMTINKSQGQSLKHVGLYLSRSVFSHGQLYVAFSRVTSRKGLKVLVIDDESQDTNMTANVVYK